MTFLLLARISIMDPWDKHRILLIASPLNPLRKLCEYWYFPSIPISTHPAAAIFICLSDIVGADRDKPAISDLKLAMEFDQPLSLPAVLGAVTSAAEDQNHRMRSLQFG